MDGIISTQAGSERFHIELIRDGDEAAITKNIEQARQSLKDAEVVPQPELLDGSTALFKYHNICPIVAQKGLERLRQTIPYLYATCKHLGRVRIIEGDAVTVFEPGLINDRALGQCTLWEVQVTVTQGDSQHITVARLGDKDGRSALLSVIEKRDDEERLRLPEESFPRLFVTFPIAGSGILPFNVVLDGQFTPEQERDGILLDHHDKSLIEAALSCLPTFVRHAVESHWTGAHNLAQLAAPTTVFTGEDDSGESEWWKTVILKTAKAIASEAIIETEAGLLPALTWKILGVFRFRYRHKSPRVVQVQC